ncbi:MAG: roadblock/LC7 domain-containing protein [Methanocellales archaeon]|nr:roadblock/LC7 domain-containing protein [Methanocellales archaeon]
MVTTAEMLKKVLADLGVAVDVEASAIISRDGLIMASDIPPGVHAETFAAMNATMLEAAEIATSQLKKSVPDTLIIEYKEGRLIAISAGPKALLVVMTDPKTRLGLVLVKMGEAAEKVKRIVEG